ncbi:MAG: class I SAM-dependent methyltransferase [Candidatus Omnitrophica bacterium]|nr:class I SAM-dependent methyltransferase [Candidatus Omnitrophota bacterium]
MFCNHSDCIKNTLKNISSKYKEKKIFLDIGCGSGERTTIFDEFNRKIYGVDNLDWRDIIHSKNIDFKKENFLKTGLSYPDDKFDIVFSFDVIEHIDDAESLVRNAFRVLKKNGVFILGTPNRYRLFGAILISLGFRKFPYHPDINTKDLDPFAAHIHEYTVLELRQLLEQCGFKVNKIHRKFYGLTGGYGIDSCGEVPFFHNIIIVAIK